MSWECRSRLVKQRPLNPTVRRGERDAFTPGPGHYDQKSLYCGAGFSHIKRAPAYSFGLRTPTDFSKPIVMPNAPQLNCRGLAKKGRYHITHSIMSPVVKPLTDIMLGIPGPGQYEPKHELRFQRPPMYSIKKRPRPPYKAPVMWSPPCNMYKPAYVTKQPPSFSILSLPKEAPTKPLPGPGDHDPNYRYVLKTIPKFSLGAPFRNPIKEIQKPDATTYCIYKIPKPAPSFGIRHSPYLGVQKVYEMPS